MSSVEQISQMLQDYPPNARILHWTRPNPKGTIRRISTPNKELMIWLRAIGAALNEQYDEWPKFMHGGIPKRSYISFAKAHIAQKCVITIDIKNCFGSITALGIAAAFKKNLYLDDYTSSQLAYKLCYKGKLALGYPTSNYICNLYLLDVLTRLETYVTSCGLKFGNFVDDIAISGDIQKPGDLINYVATELSRAQLSIKKAKVCVMPSSQQEKICELVVNSKISF